MVAVAVGAGGNAAVAAAGDRVWASAGECAVAVVGDRAGAVAGAVVGSVSSLRDNVLANDAYMCGEKESFRELIINVGSKGDERELAKKVLKSAGAGGRLQIVQELLTRWGIVEKKEEEEEGETKQNNVSSSSSSSSSSFVVVHQIPYKLTLYEKVKWVQELIDESLVVWMA